MNTALEFFNRLFSLHYDEITKKYFEFIKAFKQVNLKDKYDLYDCLISFLSFLNGNDKFLRILSKNQKNNNIALLKKIYDERRNIGLWEAVTNYCEINGIRIIFKNKNNNNNLSPEKYNIDIRELKCFVDLCPVEHSYQKFVQTLYTVTFGNKDPRNNKPEYIKNVINNIFYMLNTCLKNCNTWDESLLSIAMVKFMKWHIIILQKILMIII